MKISNKIFTILVTIIYIVLHVFSAGQDVATPGEPHVPVLILYHTIPETVHIAI